MMSIAIGRIGRDAKSNLGGVDEIDFGFAFQWMENGAILPFSVK
jgi:hypothetical protein